MTPFIWRLLIIAIIGGVIAVLVVMGRMNGYLVISTPRLPGNSDTRLAGCTRDRAARIASFSPLARNGMKRTWRNKNMREIKTVQINSIHCGSLFKRQDGGIYLKLEYKVGAPKSIVSRETVIAADIGNGDILEIDPFEWVQINEYEIVRSPDAVGPVRSCP